MRRLISALVVAGALLAPATTASAASRPTHPGLGIRLLEAPTSLANDPRARIFIIDHLAPGTTIERKIQVTNGTVSPLAISLYAAGSQIKGGAWSPYAGRTPNELSRWIGTNPTAVDLAPGQSTTAEVTIAVPRDASSGERYAVVWAQATIPGSGPIQQVARAGIRVYLSVGPGGAPPTNFTIDTLTAARTSDGSPVVLAQVHNTGGRAVDLSGKLRLTNGPGGLSAGPFPAKLGTTLAPGQSEPVTVVLDKALPAGPWNARIMLQSDLVRRAAKATITFPVDSGSEAKPVKATPIPLTKNRHVLVPIAIGLIVALLIGLLLLLLWRRRRRDDEDERSRSGVPAPTVPPQRRPAPDRDRQRQ